MKEGPPKPSESRPDYVEIALTDFRNSCELEVGHVYTEEERNVISHTLHDKLERLDTSEMLHKYESGTVPTLDSIRRAADAAIAVLMEEPDDTEAVTHAKLLEGQVMQVRRWTRRYVETVIRFHREKSRRARADQGEEIDMLVTADSERRRVHEALLSSLSTMNNMLSRAQDLVSIPSATSWRPGMVLPQGTAKEHPLVFAPEAIQDRHLIRDWAIVADGVEQLRIVVRKMEATDKSETAVPEGDGRITSVE